MNFLKELKQISEGAAKKQLQIAIDQLLVNAKKFVGPPYDEYITAVSALANEIKRSHPELTSGMSDTDLIKAIRYNFDEDQWEELNGKPVNEDTTDTEQRLIKSAGEFKLVASADGEKIFLYNINGELIVDMPVVIWKQLTGAI